MKDIKPEWTTRLSSANLFFRLCFKLSDSFCSGGVDAETLWEWSRGGWWRWSVSCSDLNYPSLLYFGAFQLLSAVPQQWCQQTAAPQWWHQEPIRLWWTNCFTCAPLYPVWMKQHKAKERQMRNGDGCSCGQESSTEVSAALNSNDGWMTVGRNSC